MFSLRIYGWLRVLLGCRDMKLHAMTFCSPECLRLTLERTPKEFIYNPHIDRQRIERRRQAVAVPFNGVRVRAGSEGSGR